MMHYWQKVLKVMEITGQNPSSRKKDSQIGCLPPSLNFQFLPCLLPENQKIPQYRFPLDKKAMNEKSHDKLGS